MEEELQRFYKTSRSYFVKLEEKEFEKWFLKYHEHMKAHEKGLILDVGCGAGQVVNKLAADGLTAVGIDISPIGIRLSHKARSNTRASFIVANCYKMPFRDNAFETVGCFDVLEHLTSPELCVDEMIRITADNGKIVIASPNLLCPIYAKSLKSILRSMKITLQRLVKFDGKLDFEHRQPILHDSKHIGRDFDAVTLTDLVAVKRILTGKRVKIAYQSSYLGSRKLIDVLSTLPLLRNIGGGIFLVGRKMRKVLETPSEAA